MEEKNKYCCEEHTDLAFDDFLLDNESFPNLETDISNHKCDYCENQAKYVLI